MHKMEDVRKVPKKRASTGKETHLRVERDIFNLQVREHQRELLARAAGAGKNDFAVLGIQQLHQTVKVADARLGRQPMR